jgi:hypothetical protein
MKAAEIRPTFSMSNIYIGLCLPKALSLTPLRSYELFRNNKSISLQGILRFPLQRDGFPHRLGRRITLKEGVP